MLDTPALTAFVAVVDSGSAHAAARRLGLSQAALSRRLQRLEASLGIKLFVRAGRGLALSEQGSQLLPKVRAHLEGLSSVLKSVRDTVRYGVPTVTLGCLPTLCTSVLPQALAAVNKRHPDIRLRIHDLSATEIRQNIADGSADVAITYLGIEERGFSQQAIIEEPMVLVVAKGHDLARQTHLPWRALSGLDLIGIGPQSGLRRLLEDARPIIGFDLNWRHAYCDGTAARRIGICRHRGTVARAARAHGREPASDPPGRGAAQPAARQPMARRRTLGARGRGRPPSHCRRLARRARRSHENIDLVVLKRLQSWLALAPSGAYHNTAPMARSDQGLQQ